MILQHLSLPGRICCDEYSLYVDKAVEGDFPVFLDVGQSLTFGGFVNGFSLTKWCKYTCVRNISLELDCEGEYEVTVSRFNSESQTDISITKNKGKCAIELPADFNDGILQLSIRAITPTRINSGSFFTKDIIQRIPHIALLLCTYHREEYVRKKIDCFLKALDVDHDFNKSIELFIVDNASELDESFLVNGKIHLYHNENTGGSGGFARGILEISKIGTFSHIVMLDDDTENDPESFYRTWSFLAMLKEQYSDAVIAGAMLYMEQKTMVHEAGATFNPGKDGIYRCHPLKHQLDISDVNGCLEYDVEEQGDYGGWWYCVYPTTYANSSNLPLQLFLKYDDVEYGIRCGKSPITLNGIFSWHMGFESKRSPIVEYYSMRNHLFVLWYLGLMAKKYMRKKTLDALSLLKHNELELCNSILDGIMDAHYMIKGKKISEPKKTVTNRGRIRAITRSAMILLKITV